MTEPTRVVSSELVLVSAVGLPIPNICELARYPRSKGAAMACAMALGSRSVVG
jgi:hypothetical protein